MKGIPKNKNAMPFSILFVTDKTTTPVKIIALTIHIGILFAFKYVFRFLDINTSPFH